MSKMKRKVIESDAVGVATFERVVGNQSFYAVVTVQVRPRANGIKVAADLWPGHAPVSPQVMATAIQGVNDFFEDDGYGVPYSGVEVLVRAVEVRAGYEPEISARPAAGDATRTALANAHSVVTDVDCDDHHNYRLIIGGVVRATFSTMTTWPWSVELMNGSTTDADYFDAWFMDTHEMRPNYRRVVVIQRVVDLGVEEVFRTHDAFLQRYDHDMSHVVIVGTPSLTMTQSAGE